MVRTNPVAAAMSGEQVEDGRLPQAMQVRKKALVEGENACPLCDYVSRILMQRCTGQRKKNDSWPSNVRCSS